MIRRVMIRNYRRFLDFQIDLAPGLNVLIGDNDAGKSTLLEAINLALTGRLNGRWLAAEMSPHLINKQATDEYFSQLKDGHSAPPPVMIIEVYFDDSKETAPLEGSNNLVGERACGVRIQATFDPDFHEEYTSFVADSERIWLVPTEYYRIDWLAFSGAAVTARSLPASVAVIDPTTMRLQSGVDHHLQQIIRTQLDPKERVELSREYRSLREDFDDRESIKRINERLRAEENSLTDRELSLSIDISQRYAWESSLTAHLDQLPFQFVGKGDQNAVKTLLALGRHADDKHVVLIEEPETHLSFSRLRNLLARVAALCDGKQVIIATHSAYVLNKLGLDATILLGEDGHRLRLDSLSAETVTFFKRLPGHDTLRLALARGAILVEGPSDELIVQRAYRDSHCREPLDDGIDVISVGTSHKRFMELGRALNRRTWAVRDNDGRTREEVTALFDGYLVDGVISLHTGRDPAYPTLEPQIVATNDLETLNRVLSSDHASIDQVLQWMTANKTDAALRIYESDAAIRMPAYIVDVCSRRKRRDPRRGRLAEDPAGRRHRPRHQWPRGGRHLHERELRPDNPSHRGGPRDGAAEHPRAGLVLLPDCARCKAVSDKRDRSHLWTQRA